jgi:hypothetical protein
MPLPIAKDVTQEGLARLLWQWKESPKLRGFFESYLENVQPLEDVYFQLLDERGVLVAVGEQLNVLGRLVGEPRYGRNDDKYRLALVNRAGINRSSGTPEELLTFLKALTRSEVVGLWEHYSSSVHLYVAQNGTPFVVHALKDAASAGVHIRLMFDQNQESLIPVDLAFAQLTLANQALDSIEVIDATSTSYELGISTGTSSTEDHGFLSEIYEVQETTQVITNPSFITDTDWTKGTGWTIAGDVASKASGTASALEQPATLIETAKYVVSYTVSGMTTGTLTPTFTGGATASGTAVTSNGTYSEIITAKSGNINFTLNASSTFDGDVDNVSLFLLNQVPVNPACEVIDNSVAILDILKVITETGDFVVDEFTNQVIGV